MRRTMTPLNCLVIGIGGFSLGVVLCALLERRKEQIRLDRRNRP